MRELPRLETGRQSFQLVEVEDREFHGLDTDALNRVVALDTRSLIGVMYFAANGIEVPQAHLDAGYATTTLDSEGKTFDWSSVLGNFFRVHSSDSMFRPDNAAVAVQYRDHWFYIADDDESSKTTFSLLYQLYVLQAGEISEEKPVLTLPVGR